MPITISFGRRGDYSPFLGFLGVSSEGKSSPSQLISVNAVAAGINSTNSSNIDVTNSYVTGNQDSTAYELFDVSYTDFRDEDSNSFTDAQSLVDYINDRAQVAQDNIRLFFSRSQAVTNNTTVSRNTSFEYRIPDSGLLSIFWKENTFPQGVTVSRYDRRIVSGIISSTGDYYLSYEKANAVGISTSTLHIEVV